MNKTDSSATGGPKWKAARTAAVAAFVRLARASETFECDEDDGNGIDLVMPGIGIKGRRRSKRVTDPSRHG